MKNKFSFPGFIILIIGSLFYFFPGLLTDNSSITFLSILFILSSLILIIFFFHKMDAIQITAVVIIFYLGSILFIKNQYELYTGTEVIFPFLLIFIGTVTTLLGIRNNAEKIFFIISVLFFGFAGFLLLFTETSLSRFLGSGIYLLIFDYWQTLFIIFGAFLIIRKRGN